MTEGPQRGAIPLARYQEQQLPEYRENPFIRALPPIPDLPAVVGLLQLVPRFDPQEVFLDGRLRAHAIARLLHGFFQPLSHHLELESKIGLMIRQGYIGRNPENGAWYAHMQNGYRRVEEEDLDAAVYQSVTSTANSLSLFGCSGCGKSRSLERILGMYPQALHHQEHSITQLVYLKIDCPIDGDLDELCLSFFNQVDKVLGTHYSRSHGRKKMGTKRLLASMCQIANLHALGVLIIDEIQNLNEARSGGAEKMHNFFVSLVNTIGVPMYAPVVLDEAFDKADNEFTALAMNIFTNFGFQMVVATPLKSVMTLEPFIGGACFVDISDRRVSGVLLIEYDGDRQRLKLPEHAREEASVEAS